MIKNIILWVVIAVVLMSLFNNFGSQGERADSSLSYSQFIDSVKAGQVQQVIIAMSMLLKARCKVVSSLEFTHRLIPI